MRDMAGRGDRGQGRGDRQSKTVISGYGGGGAEAKGPVDGEGGP